MTPKTPEERAAELFDSEPPGVSREGMVFAIANAIRAAEESARASSVPIMDDLERARVWSARWKRAARRMRGRWHQWRSDCEQAEDEAIAVRAVLHADAGESTLDAARRIMVRLEEAEREWTRAENEAQEAISKVFLDERIAAAEERANLAVTNELLWHQNAEVAEANLREMMKAQLSRRVPGSAKPLPPPGFKWAFSERLGEHLVPIAAEPQYPTVVDCEDTEIEPGDDVVWVGDDRFACSAGIGSVEDSFGIAWDQGGNTAGFREAEPEDVLTLFRTSVRKRKAGEDRPPPRKRTDESEGDCHAFSPGPEEELSVIRLKPEEFSRFEEILATPRPPTQALIDLMASSGDKATVDDPAVSLFWLLQTWKARASFWKRGAKALWMKLNRGDR